MNNALQIKTQNAKERVNYYKNDITAFLRKLISIPSTSSNEEKVVEAIRDEMTHLGYDEIIIDEMGSIIGRIGNGKTRIIYDSHIDTVGIADIAAFAFDPFEGKLENEIIYGRGASDNKAATATQVYAGKIIKDLGLLNDFTLFVVGTVQEEDCDGLALQYIMENVVKNCDYVVLGECTNLDIYRGHRGRMEILIRTKGVSAHGSAPERGENAIYKMAPIINAIENLNKKLKDDPFLGKGSIALTKIECKTASLNSIPDECTIYLDRRLTAGETKESAVAEIKEAVKNLDYKIDVEILPYNTPSYKGKILETEKYYPTWVLPEGHELVQGAANVYNEVFEKKPKISKWIFSTNGIASMGRLNVPTIGFGPSKEEYAHTTNDQVSVSHLIDCTVFYSMFPIGLCKFINK